ncbi:MAG: hypothetical protein QOE36_1400 [Gaiellaceae bacterium]|jgi:catechol 2,3-dioxygenase-like lactoylglutathione lyase family enzyme|nr:hypothetical protein [Gaiellaceae bacterium]
MGVVRYLVDDVASALDFYRDALGFTEEERFGDAFAIVRRDDLELWLSGPASSARRPMPDGGEPVPGGWNRLVLVEADLTTRLEQLRALGIHFRSGEVRGPGGTQIVLDDPSGNPIELFAPSS